MKHIKKKLRSRLGASLILAMVFMLFCSFVGGSVLASATANAQRVAQLAEQQDFLLERSAALLASDQLQLEEGKFLRLSITDADKLIEEVIIGKGGKVTLGDKAATVRVITFQVSSSAPLTQLHQLMLESTVYRYLREFAPDGDYEIAFVNFPGDPASTADFMFRYTMPSETSDDYDISGSLSVSATMHGSSGVSIPGYTANFSSGRGDDLYDFFIDFGENSQVHMTMNAYYGKTEPIQIVSPPTTGYVPGFNYGSGYIRVTTVTQQITVSWEDPLIEKGGAE